MNMKATSAMLNTTWAVVKMRPEKNSGLCGIWTHEPMTSEIPVQMVAFIFTSLSAVHINDFMIFIYSQSFTLPLLSYDLISYITIDILLAHVFISTLCTVEPPRTKTKRSKLRAKGSFASIESKRWRQFYMLFKITHKIL